MKRLAVIGAFICLCTFSTTGQTRPTESLRSVPPTAHAFINARIVVAPGRTIPKGTVVIRNGLIEDVGEKVTLPADARIWDLEGSTLYPGLIDLYSEYGLTILPPQQSGSGSGSSSPSSDSKKGAAHWNSKVKAQIDVAKEFRRNSKEAETLRSMGFALVNVVPKNGAFRGQSALISLSEAEESDLVVKTGSSAVVSFNETSGFLGGYPTSLMGAIALIRQTWLDADWYIKAWESFRKVPGQQRPEVNMSLAALADAVRGRQPVIMDADDHLDFLRAAHIGKEFSLRLLIRGGGDEYRRLDAVKATSVPVILPLNFPEPPSIQTPQEALNVSTRDLLHWDVAPENPGRLEKAGVRFALTTAQLKDRATFLRQVRKAIGRGLTPEGALRAMTTEPARMIGIDQHYGTLERGKVANFLITDGELFGEKTKILDVWIDGQRYPVQPPSEKDVRGTWFVELPGPPRWSGSMSLKGEPGKINGSIVIGANDLKFTSINYAAGMLSFSFQTDSLGSKGVASMSGSVGRNELFGVGTLPDGTSFHWTAHLRKAAPAEADTTKKRVVEMSLFKDMLSLDEFGRQRPPDRFPALLIKNATIWTQGKAGKIQDAEILVVNGKIEKIGRNIPQPANVLVIDATGKHVTPGIIDAHSHTAISGSVNEGGQIVTSEVRVEDVLNPDDIWIYRQLAGGTTAANVMHGSAHPINGQNAVVKWRWGALPRELLLEGAPPGIKFALGENPKRSHIPSSSGTPVRYPATRMGVEQVIKGRFMQTRDYRESWLGWERDKSRIPPRRDLELDAIVEILEGKRLIHAHSYRQDEILMLIRLADSFGIRIATFQHVLEGYKVADAIAQHGAGASSFSDWWGYKFEVYDAIPSNGAIMHREGVLVSYNSDDNQLATRLNWEAAKALPFGLSEEEALSFVTSNPAKQLRIDERVGSLEEGKDADFVIWSGNPLSTSTICEQTWIDGRKYFDREEDVKHRRELEKMRAAIIQRILADKSKP